MRSDVFRRIVPAALLAASFPVLLAGLLGLTAPLWLPLLTAVLSAGSAAALSGGRRPWLPYLCWAGLCAAALPVLGTALPGGLAALVNAALHTWQQVFPRIYPAYTAPQDDRALTALLAVLSALWGLWSARCTLRPRLLSLCLTALPLAAAAVVLAPAAPLWWMALAALTLLFLYLLAFGREGSAALRVWCRAAAVVLLAVTLLDGWNGAAARPAWLDSGRTAVSDGVDTLRYGDNTAAGLTGGDLTAAAPARTDTPMLTVTAIAVIAGFVVPDLAQSITLLRLAFLLIAGFWGLFGISLLGAAVLFNLCAGESFGFPITAPIAPLYKKGFRDTLTRVSFRKMQSGSFTVEEYHE